MIYSMINSKNAYLANVPRKKDTMKLSTEETNAAVDLIEMAFEEDFSEAGDLTSQALLSLEDIAEVWIVARENGILSGIPIAEIIFQELNLHLNIDESISEVQIESHKSDGDPLEPGTHIATVKGPLPLLLSGERTALNFLTHLSGVASLTNLFVDKVQGTKAEILDTRKTHPGYRLLEKYAVRCGGGTNHRMGLYDAMMIKDNHIAAWSRFNDIENPSLEAALKVAREKYPDVPLEIEVDNLEQLKDALKGKPDFVLLDNMTTDQLTEAVSIRNEMAKDVLLEASGGVNLDTVAAIAQTGVERISVGAITHSARGLDIGFDWPK